MSDVVIEFSDEELDSSITPDEGGAAPADNKGNDKSTPPADNKGFNVDDTEDDLDKGQGKPADNNDPNGNIESKPGMTNAELAALHGVSEDDIVLAKNMGWTPKDRFRGDPKDWRDPKDFIRITEESAPVMRERLRSLSKQMDSMKSTIPTILKMQTQQYKDCLLLRKRQYAQLLRNVLWLRKQAGRIRICRMEQSLLQRQYLFPVQVHQILFPFRQQNRVHRLQQFSA